MSPMVLIKPSFQTSTIAKVYDSGKVTFTDRLPNGLGTRGPVESEYWTWKIRKLMTETGQPADILAIQEMSKVGFARS